MSTKPSRQHRWPTCKATGKLRFGELKDARQALKQAVHARWSAELDGVSSPRREIRAYRCAECRGYHLTSTRARGSLTHLAPVGDVTASTAA